MSATVANPFPLIFGLVLLAAATPVAAQDVQGPPDGFRPPQDSRPPAQGPADNGITPLPVAPRPVSAPPREPAAEPAPPPAAQPLTQQIPAPARAAPTPAAPAPVRAEPPVASQLPAGESESPAADAPLAPPLAPPSTSVLPAPTDAPAGLSGTATAAESRQSWQSYWWLLLLLPATAAAWALRRRSRPTVLAPAAAPARAAPNPSPPAQPKSSPPAPPPPPSPPAPAPAPAPIVPPAAPERVVGRAKLTMTLQLREVEIRADQLRIQFALLLANSGDRAATGGLARIALQQANARQAELLGRFFDGAGGSVLAEGIEVAAGDVGSIERNALLPLDGVEMMLIGGYPSLVPVIGFDVTYHWDSDDDGFGQVAAAFVVGSAAAADGRIAPIRTDLGARRILSPAARVTDMVREQ